jgi:hypothetical protein
MALWSDWGPADAATIEQLPTGVITSTVIRTDLSD